MGSRDAARPAVSDPEAGTAAPVAPPGRSLPRVLRQLVVFACVGGVFNVFYLGLYFGIRGVLGIQASNAIALIVSTMAGTAGHRRVTFGVRGGSRAVRHQVLGLVLLAFGLAVTAGSLWLLHATTDPTTRLAESIVLVAANLFVGLVRFAAFRTAMQPSSAS